MSPGRLFIPVVLSLLVAGTAVAGQQEFRFDPLSVEQGLSNSSVNHILQDGQGFLWIATTDGLNRYDGHELTIFRHDPLDPGSLAGNWIDRVVADSSGRLWIYFGIGGVDLFDPDTERFRHFRHVPDDPASLPDDRIYTMVEDASGGVWFGGHRGVFRLIERAASDGSDGAVELGFEPLAGFSQVPTSVLRSDAHGLWIGSWNGLFRTRLDTGAIERVALPGESASQGHAVTDVVVDDDGVAWVGTVSGGLLRRDPADGTWSRLEGLRDWHVSEILPDPSGSLWVRGDSGCIDLLDPRAGRLERLEDLPGFPDEPTPHFTSMLATDELLLAGSSDGLLIVDKPGACMNLVRYDTGGPAPLTSNAITVLYADRSGILWVGTAGGGVNKLDQRSLQFHHTRVPLDDPTAQHVLAVHETADGTLWLGTPAGLVVERDDDWRRWRHDPKNAASLSGNQISAIVEDADGVLWIATGAGLDEVVATRGELRVRRHRPGGHTVSINSITPDGTGALWLATGGGLARYEPATGATEWYQADAGDPHALPSNLVQLAYVDRRGTIWVGTYVGGLSRYRPDTDDFESFLFDADDPFTINNLSVTTMLDDSAGRLWVGTYSGGLNLLDRETGRFEHVTQRDGLAGNKVNGIIEDATGILWVSTNQGLTRFDPVTRTCSSYDVNDGLQSNEFIERSAFQSAAGELLFGGIAGLNRFSPTDIQGNRSPPPLALTAFKRFDERVPLRTVVEDGTIQLAHDDSFISFEFVALDFTNPRKNRYAYKLEGFDDDWIESGTRRYAAYTNLDPGRYTFRVRGANSDGVWNDEGLTFALMVTPPFWQQPLFYWILGAALAALAVLAHLYWVRVKVRQSVAIERVRFMERERVREQVARDYHDELGHKLTKISLFTELVKRHVDGDRDQLVTYVAKVADFADGLSRDARDFIWTLNPHMDSLYDVGVYLQDFGTSLFDDAGPRFRVDGLDRRLGGRRLSSDRKRHLILIFKEAMTNALRHAEPEHVTLRFGGVNGSFEVTLEDDGVGFDAAGNGSSVGGSGLDNMRRRSQQLDGELRIDSATGVGTRVSFRSRSDYPNQGIAR